MRWPAAITNKILNPSLRITSPSCVPLLSVAPSLSTSILKVSISSFPGHPNASVLCKLAVCQRQLIPLRRKVRDAEYLCGASKDARTADNKYRDDFAETHKLISALSCSLQYDFDLDWLSPLASTTTPPPAGVMEVPCHACRGRGYVQCPLCERAPHPACERCAGKGCLVCPACQGMRVEVVSRRGPAAEKFLEEEEDEDEGEEEEGDLVLPLVRTLRKSDRRPEPSVETRTSVSVKKQQGGVGIGAQRIREAIGGPQKSVARRKVLMRGNSTQRKQRQFVDPANPRKPSYSAMGHKAYRCSCCGEKGHRRPYCPQGGYQSAQLGPPRPYTCGLCGERGHGRARCPLRPGGPLPETRRCSLCGEEGHNRQNCAVRGEGPPTWLPRRRNKGVRTHYSCGLCGEEGHGRRTCPKRVRGEGDRKTPSWRVRAYTCHCCGEGGHSSRSCVKRKMVGG